ncbi:hypothetical protein C5167_018670 [Papaver somniferum]|uniref:BHLH domain-containing protein n=1 Tax=Papaver somniferum TaxID=3469 RepID=A0A4Y7IS42_PAPSO|nr:uncharacterized protein LOC113353637 [Papaver somniferum]RZC50255.1 hypothetical protein C5167_018670 [Papaver somniferum]
MNSSHGSHSSSSSSSFPRSSSEERGNNLSQQLQTLQSMIPNIPGTADDRSILEAAHGYIQRIHEETESIEKELLQRRRSTTTRGSSSSSLVGVRPKILSMEIDDLMIEGRFVVKISWRRGFSENGLVQRVLEDCLNVTMTSILDEDNNPDCMLTTAFVKVKEGTRMTEEQLRDQLMNIAASYGLMP